MAALVDTGSGVPAVAAWLSEIAAIKCSVTPFFMDLIPMYVVSGGAYLPATGAARRDG
ncbi:MAG: hypothetical protein V4724_16420 [Pseudomonadota bacterium]